MKLKALFAVPALTVMLAATGCGAQAGTGTKGLEASAEDGLTVGISYDRPGLSIKNPDGSFSGFDVDVAKYIAAKLGVEETKITWLEAPTAQRENLIQNGQVDYVANTYSINDARKEKVGFAGPYFLAGQSLLVRAEDNSVTGPESLNGGKKLCSITGSTPAQNIKKNYAQDVQLQEYDTLPACVEALKSGAVDAMTTDDSQLAGYAAVSNGKLKLVGATFSKENYGIGVKKDDTAGRNKINDALEEMVKDGSWAKAFEKNLGPSGYPMPTPPAVNRY